MEENTTNEEIFRGVISRITFRNEENGFSVFKAEANTAIPHPSQDNSVNVVGVIPVKLNTGSHILAKGQWVSHPKFGKQFKANSITETQPTTKDTIEKYLGSGIFKGLGPVLAQRIVEVFGDQALEIMDNHPEKLKKVPGIGQKKLEEVLEAWREKKELREVLLFFQSHNISSNLAQRIYKNYGKNSIEKVKNNPYVLCRDVWGIGFKTADNIALALGIKHDAPERIIAGIAYVLKRASDDGHCFLSKETLLLKTQELLRIEELDLVNLGLTQAIISFEVILENENIYLPLLHKAEVEVGKILASRINNCSSNLNIQAALLENCIESTKDSLGRLIKYSEEQQNAIKLAASNKLLVITGGPGCGKTTVVKAIANLFTQAGLNIKLAAPTGRAAQRLTEVCNLPASTIHRLLKFDPYQNKFVYDKENKLEADVLIIDESSMIDITLAMYLLQAVPANCHLIFVGDVDQLPSVGPGLFLADLLSISNVPRVRLNILFRRKEESLITQIAHQINAAEIPELPQPDGQTKSDVYFISAKTPEEAAQTIEKLVVNQIPKFFKYAGSEIMVLSPMNQGELGIVALNKKLQDKLVPQTLGAPTVKSGHLEFRLGDRVCQRANNYKITEAGVFNGDQGQIVGIDGVNRTITVKFWDGREVLYAEGDILELDLAYALTIHRSQGSEVPVVVLALHETHSILLERQLFYTAVTRAKKMLFIVGSKKAIALATKKSRSKKRNSGLALRVNNIENG